MPHWRGFRMTAMMHLYTIYHRGGRFTDQWAHTPWEAVALANVPHADVINIEMIC